MTNELFFIIHAISISLFAIFALKQGKESLVAFLCVQAVLSNFFLTKQIIIFGFCATCADAFSVGCGICLNLLQEYYGRNIAQKAVCISFFMLFFYLVMSQIHLFYIPSKFDVMQPHFEAILNFAPRIVIVSLISYFISQQIDIRAYAYFRTKFSGKFFIFRNYSSLIISQFVDTLIFTIFGLYGVMTNLFEIFIISYSIKLLTIFIATPIVTLSKKFIKPNNL